MGDKNIVGRNHRDRYEELSEDVLIDWYIKCNPKGSGPLGIMWMLCAVIEEVAELKGFELPK